MLLDKQALIWDDQAYDDAVVTTPVAFDLGAVRPGPGKRIKMFINCGGGDMADLTGIALTDCDTVGGSYTALKSVDISHTELNAGTFYFDLPPQTRQFLKLALTSATAVSAGTNISAGVVMDEQTNL